MSARVVWCNEHSARAVSMTVTTPIPQLGGSRQQQKRECKAVMTTEAQRKLYAIGRLKTGEMNASEAAFDEMLRLRVMAGEIAWYKFEGLKLRLADNTFYTPDFAVMLVTGLLECHEVKGFWLDDARAKIKIAADMYPFRFLAHILKKRTKRDGGGYSIIKTEEF